MGVVYLAALVAGLGVLLVQVAFGGRGAHHDPTGLHHVGAAHAQAHDGSKPGASLLGLFSVFISFRFWIFALLGFGLSGSILHVLHLASRDLAIVVASCTGVGSGLFAALALRAAARSQVSTSSDVGRAIGGTGRVLVALGKSATGKIRIEIGGSSIDVLATTDEDELARDEVVLVEDVKAGIAHVARRPRELE